MKVTSKLVVGVVLCAGFVQVTSPKLVSIEVIKENPNVNVEYFISHEQGLPFVESDSYTRVEDGKKISFDAAELINNLYVKKSNGKQNPTHMIDLNKAPVMKEKEDFDLIVIRNEGPGYGNRKHELELRKQRAKLKKQKKD